MVRGLAQAVSPGEAYTFSSSMGLLDLSGSLSRTICRILRAISITALRDCVCSESRQTAKGLLKTSWHAATP